MKIAVLAIIAFAIPVGIVMATNWEEVRPFLVGDPDITPGRMLYFATRG